MDSNKNINDELNELNSGLPGAPGPVYSVPEGYFDGLAASVLARIKGGDSSQNELSQLSPFLAGISRKMPYAVPEGYFESTIENLSALTSDEDSLVLSFISRENVYEVPLGYFANFPEQIMEKLSRREARVVPIMKRKWVRMAVAAMVTGVLILSGITYFNTGKTDGNQPVAVEIKKASTEELDAFVQAAGAEVQGEQNTAQNSAAVKNLLKDVSDEELEAFLDQVPVEEEEFDLN